MQGFPKAFRLRNKREFDYAMNGGWRRSTANLVIIARDQQLGGARLGLIVSRKVGNAVCRNRIKRQLREIFRLSKASLPSWDIVVIAKPNASKSSFETLHNDFKWAIEKISARMSTD